MQPDSRGQLFYVVGASGVGKDSLLNYARQRLAGGENIIFAHRYITRPADGGGENHVALSEAEFFERLRNGLFCMHWECHGNHYGIGIEINHWLNSGTSVVINGSREYFAIARKLYPELCPILLQGDENLRLKRLLARAREPRESIVLRLNRAKQFEHVVDDMICLQNNGPLEQAGSQLVELLLQHRASS